MLPLKVHEHLQMMPRLGEGQQTVQSDIKLMKKFPVSAILALFRIPAGLSDRLSSSSAILLDSLRWNKLKADQLSGKNPRDRLSSTSYR